MIMTLKLDNVSLLEEFRIWSIGITCNINIGFCCQITGSELSYYWRSFVSHQDTCIDLEYCCDYELIHSENRFSNN
jgi:hypothetical protein